MRKQPQKMALPAVMPCITVSMLTVIAAAEPPADIIVEAENCAQMTSGQWAEHSCQKGNSSSAEHEHFQSGHHTFPMEKAEPGFSFDVPGFEDVDCCVVKRPMTVIRLNSENKNQICELAGKILAKWRSYSDPDAMIFAETDGEPHNTIMPIARIAQDGSQRLPS